MALMFYPHEEDIQNGTIKEKLDILLEAAERYKATVLDVNQGSVGKTISVPREMTHAFNWQEIAKILREIREMPEANEATRVTKADCLMKLAEIYEALRAAKMPKLEAVRLALVNEANQLRAASNSSSHLG
jgi:hypothetical protein